MKASLVLLYEDFRKESDGPGYSLLNLRICSIWTCHVPQKYMVGCLERGRHITCRAAMTQAAEKERIPVSPDEGCKLSGEGRREMPVPPRVLKLAQCPKVRP